MRASRWLAIGVAAACLRCSSDRLRPIDDPQPPAPTTTPPVVVTPPEQTPPPPPAPPPPPPPPPPICTCPASINNGCANNGRCDASGACVYDTVANGTACTTNSLSGECIDRSCVPFDTQVYGAPPEPSVPWCPVSGVGLPSTQRLRPIPAASCTIYGASQMGYGNCPIETFPLASFEDTSLASRSHLLFDLRLLKFAGVMSMRVRIPDEAATINFSIIDFAWGAGLSGYKLSISDEPCDVNNVVSRFDAQHCEGPGLTLPAITDNPHPPSNQPCNALHPGHIYYFNIAGDGPADPGEDGIIDAGERLLITLTFDRS